MDDRFCINTEAVALQRSFLNLGITLVIGKYELELSLLFLFVSQFGMTSDYE